ncbi:MAG: hypothetical protein LUD72_12400, partial [Bacteroidales bacterium]|nr:hypothetical protein [Bacteroidales bacterium]
CVTIYEELTDGFCDTFCRAESEVTDDGLYKAYRRVLPMSVRLGGLRRRHVCFENPAMLVFHVGNKFYTFNKLDITDKGYLRPARRVKTNDEQ